jgi:hypothetical protein
MRTTVIDVPIAALPGAARTDWITNMNTSRLISALALAGAVSCAVAASATAAPAQPSATVSANWSGYEVSTKDNKPFSSVSGSWIEPSTNCSSGQGYGSFWVGLGGAEPQSQALEQVGTSANCGNDGNASHFAWYELVPAAPVQLNMTISPGDHISGRVRVSGMAVTVSLADLTTGASFTKTMKMNDPDTSTADWIAEAPSSCDASGRCRPLPLSDFGTVHFTNTSATSRGHMGPISDPAWTPQPIELNPAAAGYPGAGFVGTGAGGSATPSSLSADGSSFSVTTGSGDQSSAPAGLYGGSPSGDGSAPIVVWIYG